jgi:transcriptional antiterminator NusG
MSTPETDAEERSPEAVATEEAAPEESAARRNSQWFVIHTYSGYENKVKTNLEKRVNSMGMEDQIFQVLVPVEETLEVKDGKKRTIQRKIFPGYVLVEMTMTDDSWYVVRNTPGVTGFVGSGSKPTPLLPEEVDQIMYQMGLLEARPRPVAKIDVEVGENIRVRSGPFDGFIGVIDEIDAERGKLRVLVSMFGRETPLELDFAQVEKL